LNRIRRRASSDARRLGLEESREWLPISGKPEIGFHCVPSMIDSLEVQVLYPA